LKKTFIYDAGDKLSEEPMKTIGTKIEWKEGKNITEKTIEKVSISCALYLSSRNKKTKRQVK